MASFLESELGNTDSQVSVQDFDTGVGNEVTTCDDVKQADGSVKKECATRSVDRFLIYTEITTLISDAKRAKIVEQVKAKFGEGTRVDSRENSDTFYLGFDKDADILTRERELKATFAEIGFPKITVSSDFERQLEVDFLREQDLQRQDRERSEEAGAEIEGAEVEATVAAYEARKATELVGKVDKRFTVHVEELRAKVAEKMEADFPGQFITVESSTSVSPSVGKDLFNNGLLAILYALIGILIYITVRFDFRYAPGAVVALIHDVIITMGLFAILQVKFSLPIIAALLTIVGYSLNDTIVVLDRVRETFESFRGRSLTDLLNRAINSTLSRTVLTSLTTMLVVLAILLFGGGQIRDFALALFIGIIVGTYSSIFIASPLVYYMDQYLQSREAQAKTDGQQKKGGKRAKATV
ncbi:MAG: protein translocase subunit SecF [Deltaproteobacteria bacterium]|nr:MAG: protein translocase subunit SecF [Deltaproteobacteria bacterium]